MACGRHMSTYSDEFCQQLCAVCMIVSQCSAYATSESPTCSGNGLVRLAARLVRLVSFQPLPRRPQDKQALAHRARTAATGAMPPPRLHSTSTGCIRARRASAAALGATRASTAAGKIDRAAAVQPLTKANGRDHRSIRGLLGNADRTSSARALAVAASASRERTCHLASAVMSVQAALGDSADLEVRVEGENRNASVSQRHAPRGGGNPSSAHSAVGHGERRERGLDNTVAGTSGTHHKREKHKSARVQQLLGGESGEIKSAMYDAHARAKRRGGVAHGCTASPAW